MCLGFGPKKQKVTKNQSHSFAKFSMFLFELKMTLWRRRARMMITLLQIRKLRLRNHVIDLPWSRDDEWLDLGPETQIIWSLVPRSCSRTGLLLMSWWSFFSFSALPQPLVIEFLTPAAFPRETHQSQIQGTRKIPYKTRASSSGENILCRLFYPIGLRES